MRMLSIIIPTLNEEKMISELISRLLAELPEDSSEIIIADGGSTDSTLSIVRAARVNAISCDKAQRARQMNQGAKHASGEYLYFLHADSFPPVGFVREIRHAIKKGYFAGSFRLSFDDPHPVLRFYGWFTQFDLNLFRFGDQSLFVKRSLFESINGFDERLHVMEDQEIVHRIKKTGAAFTMMESAVTTSARKYKTNGVIRLQLLFFLITLLYYAGARQETLVHLYKSLLK